MALQEKYINLFTDFGFKKIFGEDVNKELLISFLNTILPDNQIAELTHRKTEHLAQTDLDRKVIYDLYCENEKGEKFIVELQKAKQSFFKDRTLYYSTFPIQEQAQRGEWDYELKAVYTIAVLDFCFKDDEEKSIKTEIKLLNTATHEVFYDKLTFLYLQMPNFRKTEEELETQEDKWFYILRNLHKLQDRPAALQERIFDSLFRSAEIAMLESPERTAYEDSLKYYRDVKNSLDTAKEEGKEEGREEGIEIGFVEGEKSGIKKSLLNTAENSLKEGLSVNVTAKITGLSESEVQSIADKLKA